MKAGRNWLRTLRNAKSISMRQVSSEAGISESYYSLIESGERRPSPEVAKKLAVLLGFDWTKFFEDSQQDSN